MSFVCVYSNTLLENSWIKFVNPINYNYKEKQQQKKIKRKFSLKLKKISENNTHENLRIKHLYWVSVKGRLLCLFIQFQKQSHQIKQLKSSLSCLFWSFHLRSYVHESSCCYPCVYTPFLISLYINIEHENHPQNADCGVSTLEATIIFVLLFYISTTLFCVVLSFIYWWILCILWKMRSFSLFLREWKFIF